MSGSRAIDYGDAAVSQPAGKALGYGQEALHSPGTARDPAESRQATRTPADPEEDGDGPPPGAEGLHPPGVVAQFNALALDQSLLDRNRIPEVPGLERLVKTTLANYRAVLLARIIHAVGRPDLHSTAINLVFRLLNRLNGSAGATRLANQILSQAPAEDHDTYNGAAVFELLRQLAAAADAAPGSRWATGWDRMAPALDALFGPGVDGDRLLGGHIDRPCEDIFRVISLASSTFGPGSGRVRGAIVSAMDNGTIGGLQGLTRYNGLSDLPNLRLDVSDPRNVLRHADAYRRDIGTLARLMSYVLENHASLRYARIPGVQQSFLLLLLFLSENHLATAMPRAIDGTAFVLASRARQRPELLDECGVHLGLIVGAIQSALVEAMDSPRRWADTVTAAGAVASLVPKVPTPVTVAVTLISGAASITASDIDERRARRARNERDSALANAGDLADARARDYIADKRRLRRFIGLRLAGTNDARRIFGLPTM